MDHDQSHTPTSGERQAWGGHLKATVFTTDDLAMDTKLDFQTNEAGVRDVGSTLMEILVAVVLLGTAVLSMIGAIRVVILASTTSDDQAKVEAILTSAADRLSATEYVPCPDIANGDYANIAAAAKTTVSDPSWSDANVQIVELKFWDATSGSARTVDGDPIDADGSWSDTNSMSAVGCSNNDINLTTSRTLQRMTIRVTAPGGGLSRTIEVVKSPIVANPEPTPTNTTP